MIGRISHVFATPLPAIRAMWWDEALLWWPEAVAIFREGRAR